MKSADPASPASSPGGKYVRARPAATGRISGRHTRGGTNPSRNNQWMRTRRRLDDQGLHHGNRGLKSRFWLGANPGRPNGGACASIGCCEKGRTHVYTAPPRKREAKISTDCALRVTPGHDNHQTIIVFNTAKKADKSQFLEVAPTMCNNGVTPYDVCKMVIDKLDVSEWKPPVRSNDKLPELRELARKERDQLNTEKRGGGGVRSKDNPILTLR